MAQGKATNLCGAKKKSGDPCGKPAGWGTPHTGSGTCRFHGGCTPNAVKHAQAVKAETAVITYGLPREIDPHAALLEELHRTAGHVSWLASLIRAFEKDGDLKQTSFGENGSVDRPSVWVELYNNERKHFAAVAKTCIGVGIEERRVKLAEDQGQIMVEILRGVLSDLGINPASEEARSVVRKHLTLVQGGLAV